MSSYSIDMYLLYSFCWKVVILMKFALWAVLIVFILKTFNAAGDDQFIKTTIF